MVLFQYSSPFPFFFMRRYYAGDRMQNWAQKSNNWTGLNLNKWQDAEYDQLYERVLVERDPGHGRALWQRLNDIVARSHTAVPIVERKFIMALENGLVGPTPRVFESETWNIAEWTRRG
jgi:peptide/nickel transport system substrate-binding protein